MNAIAWSASSEGDHYYNNTLEQARSLLVPYYPDLLVEAAVSPLLVEMGGLWSPIATELLDIDMFISSFDLYPDDNVAAKIVDRSVQTSEGHILELATRSPNTFMSAQSALSDVFILNRILMLLGLQDGLTSRSVSRLWCTVVTQYTHRVVYFRLPGDWQWGYIDHDVVALWVAITELAFLLFVSRWGVAHTVRKIVQVNWIYQSTCFFRRVLPNISVLEIRSSDCSPVNVPQIPYPFMVPSSVTDLTLDGCSLCMHSLEGMMSPGMRLVALSVFNIYHGFLVS